MRHLYIPLLPIVIPCQPWIVQRDSAVNLVTPDTAQGSRLNTNPTLVLLFQSYSNYDKGIVLFVWLYCKDQAIVR